MSPATACLLCLGVGQIGVLLALRGPVLRWAGRPGAAAVLRAVGPRRMTVYLWHMSAMVVVAGGAAQALRGGTRVLGGLMDAIFT